MAAKTKILIAEDDDNIREGLIDALAYEGYDAMGAPDGSEALKAFCQWKPDLIVLDVMMPRKSGYDVCREIRRGDRKIPIIMLTAKGEELDKVLGLELGADDYMAKPFGLKELLARIRAVLRRTEPDPSEKQETPVPDLLVIGGTVVDFKRMECSRGGGTQRMSKIELDIIRALAGAGGAVVERNALMARVWGPGSHGCSRKLDQHISQLRKKIEADPANPRIIESVYGTGYRMNI